MSQLTITPYFPFRRLKIFQQQIVEDGGVSRISTKPNLRFRPICHRCSNRGSSIEGWEERSIRDLNLASKKVYLECR